MSFELTGIVHKIFEIQSKSETFKTREFVVTTEDNYPQFIKFQLTQDRCSIIDQCKEGEQLKVYFDLRGREWNEKYFTNLNAWKVEKVSAAPPVDGPPPPAEEPFGGFESFDKDKDSVKEEFGDLPF